MTSKAETTPEKQKEEWNKRLQFILTLLCTLSLATGYIGGATHWISHEWVHLMYFIAYLSGGYWGLVESIKSLKSFRINVDFLMIIAALGAASVDKWMEGATLLFLFALSNTLQTFAMEKSRKAIQALMKLRPNEALVLNPDGSKELVFVELLQPGQEVLIKPGERVPIDGIVRDGKTSIDQSAITGESIPVSKEMGSEVFAGTMNLNGAIEIEVTKMAKDTTLAKIIQMVEQAQARKAKSQRFLDDFEPIYATVVIASTILLILVPYLLFHQPFDATFYRAMKILVVASPCALIISTPASILSAIANAARNGILFKGGAYLEQAASINTIAFDKTGTLTEGKPKVTDIIAVAGLYEVDLDSNEKSSSREPNDSSRLEDEVLSVAAIAESKSEHHLGAAIVKAATELNGFVPEVSEMQTITGMGVVAPYDGGEIRVGNFKLQQKFSIDWPKKILGAADKLESEGKTVVFVSRGTEALGLIAISDVVRKEAPDAIKRLMRLGIKRFIMLTGDAKKVAQSVSGQLGIEEVYAQLMPDEKVKKIGELSEETVVAMVGDGVNDAPAMASSNLGIAMGAAGTDVALETADVVLMSDDLNKLPYVLGLARKSRVVVWQNIIFSLSVIVFLVLSVFFFEIPLTLGVVGHEGSTLLVVVNGLRLLGYKGN